eukprot:EG_transcript_40304
MTPPVPPAAAVPCGRPLIPPGAVVGTPATATELVVDGCVVEDPRAAALLLIKEHLSPLTTVCARSRSYEVHTQLAEGLSSALFQVEETKANRFFALKLVPICQEDVGETYATAALLRRLHHEHILPCHDFFEYAEGGLPFLCLKLTFCPR